MAEGYRSAKGNIGPAIFIGTRGTGSPIVDRIAARAIRLTTYSKSAHDKTLSVRIQNLKKQLDERCKRVMRAITGITGALAGLIAKISPDMQTKLINANAVRSVPPTRFACVPYRRLPSDPESLMARYKALARTAVSGGRPACTGVAPSPSTKMYWRATFAFVIGRTRTNDVKCDSITDHRGPPCVRSHGSKICHQLS